MRPEDARDDREGRAESPGSSSLKPSREIRDLILGIYRDLEDGADPASVISMSDDGVFIGSGIGEYWLGGRAIRAAHRAMNDQSDDAYGEIRVLTIQAFEEGTVGWASDRKTSQMADGRVVTVRSTYVLHREQGAWKIIQSHDSLEVGNLEALGQDVDLSMDAIAGYIEQVRPDLAPHVSSEGTLTIVFTDIVSSTSMNETLGDGQYVSVLLEHNEIVENATASAGGTVVKSLGDGYMLAFASARAAARCAVAIQQTLSERDGQVVVRMGMHTGEPVRHADDFFGRDVAFAARVAAAAGGGEILASEAARALISPGGGFTFVESRALELKGFEGPQTVHRMVGQPAAAGGSD